MKISLVLPVYNEVAILQTVLEKYLADLQKTGADFEIVAVNDGSDDGSEDILLEYSKLHRALKVVNLDSRYGKQAAISAGFDTADKKSDAVILADVDILNPVGVIQKVVKMIENGEKIVYARRENMGFDKIKAGVSDICVKIAAKIFGVDGFYTGKANVSGFARAVVDVMLELPDRNKFMRAMDTWIGWKIRYITYASGYNKLEQKNILAASHKMAKSRPMTKTSKQVYRDKVREHTASSDMRTGFLVASVLALVLAIVLPFSGLGAPLWARLSAWLLFVLMFALAGVYQMRAVLIKRVGVRKVVYNIGSTLN